MSSSALDIEFDNFVAGYFERERCSSITVYSDASQLIEDLGLNSLDFISLLAAAEARFDFVIGDDDMRADQFTTLGALRAYVCKAVGV